MVKKSMVLASLFAGSLSLQLCVQAAPQPVGSVAPGVVLLPTGRYITPKAAPNTQFFPLATQIRSDKNGNAAEAVKTALSPDGKQLLVMTSGYNTFFFDETTGALLTYPVLDPTTGQATTVTTPNAEWVFVFDVTGKTPVKIQQINIPNTYNGLTWSPDGKRFFVSAGIDDRVYIYKQKNGQFIADAPFILLGHNDNQTAPLPSYNGGLLKNTLANFAVGNVLSSGAVVANVAVSADGRTLAAANFENDSLSLVNLATRTVTQEVKFFTPGGTVATGEFPFDVVIASNPKNGRALTAYVSSQRDDEVLAVDVSSGTVIAKIAVENQPNKMVLSNNQNALYVVNGNSDSVSVIDTRINKVVKTFSLLRPGYKYKGANPNAIALSPDNNTLYITLGGENAVAVVDARQGTVLGRIPTGWYPNSVTVSQDGKALYVVNAKSNSGPNPDYITFVPPYRDAYVWALEKAGLAVIPLPSKQTLARLSQQVDKNNGFVAQPTENIVAFLRNKIKHVIYVVKENRTYDQLLGDLPGANGDPSLVIYGKDITPNNHKMARDFLAFDNFYDSGESSGVGWGWSTYGRTTDYTEKTQSVLYGNSGFLGLTYDYEGTNRNINPTLPETVPITQLSPFSVRITGLLDPTGSSSILPGTKDVNAPEGDNDLDPQTIGGYIWDSALRAGKTVRNYGFFVDLAYYGTSEADPTQPDPLNPLYLPISATPYPLHPQAVSTKPALQAKTDIYFRSFDQKAPDIYLFDEWNREFHGYVANNNLPDLTLLRLAHDHTGDFSNAVAGINTPELQVADNDYALGKVLETLSHSPYWKDTMVVVVEDDSQDGPDHVDTHRSVAHILSAYSQLGRVNSTNYTTVNLLRTIEDVLGIDHISQYDANAAFMADAFSTTPNYKPFNAVIPGLLCQPPVDPNLIPGCSTNAPKTPAVALLHDGKWWADHTQGFNFREEDKLNPMAYNRIMWQGIKGDGIPYPGTKRLVADRD